MASDLDVRMTTSARDFGLLILRLAIGLPVLQAGLMKAFSFNTTVDFMTTGGWRAPLLAAIMVTATETLGGLAIIVGLLTPLAACGAMAAMLDAWAVNVSGGSLWKDPFNITFVLALGAAAVICAGAGRYSLDERLWGRGWWPRLVSYTLLAIAIVAAVVTWVILNGTNPIHI